MLANKEPLPMKPLKKIGMMTFGIFFSVVAMVGEANADKIFISNKLQGGIYILDENSLRVVEIIPPEIATAKIMAATEKKIIFLDTAMASFFDRDKLSLISDFDFDAHPTPGSGKAVISPDQKYLYVGVMGWGKAEWTGIYIIDLKNEKTFKLLENKFMHTGMLGISKDGKFLYVPEKSNIIDIIDLSEFQSAKKIQLDLNDDIQDVIGTSKEEAFVAVNSSKAKSAETKESYARLKKIGPGNITMPSLLLPSTVLRLALTSDEKTIFALCRNQLVEIDANKLQILTAVPMEATNLALSSDEKKVYLLSASKNQLTILNAENFEVVKTMTIGEEPSEIMVI
jgi:DNA-binding beta-propeller fold protein YncE